MRRYLWPVVALVLVVSGAAIYLSSAGSTYDFGWFADVPCESPALPPGLVVLSDGELAGGALAVLGLLALTATIAFRAGRREAASSTG